MRFTLGLPFMSHPIPESFLTSDALASAAVVAEAAGFESVWLTEHPAPPDRWLSAGGHDSLDPFVALAFAAAATKSLRLLTNLTVLPFRNPFLLAKSVATLDRLSGGRVTLGVGTGYLKSEYRALGVDFDTRNDSFEESLQVLRAVWSGRSVAHDGVRFSTPGVTSLPVPVQDPIPIWIGGNSRLARHRVAHHAQGWMPMWNPAGGSSVVRTPPLESVADLAEMIAVLARQVVDDGRNGSIDVAITLPPGMTWRARTGRHVSTQARSVLEAAAELDEAGVTVLVIDISARDPQEFTDTVESFADEVIRPMTAADRDSTPSVGGLERFIRAAALLGVDVAPVRYPQGTRTAADAAAAISCDVSQIAKSLVLASGDGFVLALTAGHHRVDFEKLARLTGEPVKMADPDRAREVTGFSIGGTPPFAHSNRIPIYIDPALMSHGTVYGAAGTPDTCFPIAPSELLDVTGAIQADFVVD